jgi:hypothetical protein
VQTAIQVVWWIGLIGAVIATLIIVKEVALVLRVLGHIHQLAELTREAAQGVAANATAVSRFPELEGPARGLREGTGSLASAAASLERKLDAVAAVGPPSGA